MVTRLLPPALLAPPGGFEVLGAAHAAHGALRSESSASAAEEYAGSRLALVARTRRSTSEPGAITRLIPPSPRALSWLEPATSTERQLRSIARQPRRSIAIPLAPSVIALPRGRQTDEEGRIQVDGHPVVAVRVLGKDHRIVVVVTGGVLVSHDQGHQKAAN